MASTTTPEEVRRDLERARELLAETEAQWLEGSADYKRLDAVKQEVAFRQGLLEAVTKREAKREAEAAKEARIEKAHKDHATLLDFYSSGLTELAGVIEATRKQMVQCLETIIRFNTGRSQVHGEVDWRAMNEVSPVAGVDPNAQDLNGPPLLLGMVQDSAASVGLTPPLGSYESAHGRFPRTDAIEAQLATITQNNAPAPEPEVATTNGSRTTKGSAK